MYIKSKASTTRVVLAVFTAALLLSVSSNFAGPPGAVAWKYHSWKNGDVSDDFGSINWSKWTYRTQGSGIGQGGQYVYPVSNWYMSFKGIGSAKKAGGLSSKKHSHFGFYQTRFRMINFSHSSTVWHPSIWSSPFNMAGSSLPTPGGNWVEIDFMEFNEAWPTFWHTQLIPRRNNVTAPFSGRPLLYKRSSGYNQWVTIGLEYTPTYVQLWEYAGSWQKRGTRIYSTTGANTKSKMYYKCFSPQYWILGNKYHSSWGSYKGDSWLHVDYFYHFKMK